jgi:hypothetical protein
MQVKGTLLKILDQENISEKFSKKTVIVRTKEEYPQEIPVEFTNKKIELLGSYKEGDDVEIAINIRGREWKGNNKWFVSIDGWKINSLVAEVSNGTQNPDRAVVADDMPF